MSYWILNHSILAPNDFRPKMKTWKLWSEGLSQGTTALFLHKIHYFYILIESENSGRARESQKSLWRRGHARNFNTRIFIRWPSYLINSALIKPNSFSKQSNWLHVWVHYSDVEHAELHVGQTRPSCYFTAAKREDFYVQIFFLDFFHGFRYVGLRKSHISTGIGWCI